MAKKKKSKVYECIIKYELTGGRGETDETEIWVLAKNPKEAIEKASHYRNADKYIKKVIDVKSAKLEGEIDKK